MEINMGTAAPEVASNTEEVIVRLMARELADHRVDLEDFGSVVQLLKGRNYTAQDINSLAERAVGIARSLEPQPREVLPGA